MHRYISQGNLTVQRSVGGKQQLLSGLPPGIKGPAYLRSPERAVVQVPRVITGKRHAKSHAMINDGVTDLGKPVDIGLARAEIAAFQSVHEQPLYGIVVVPVIFCGIDTSLGRD